MGWFSRQSRAQLEMLDSVIGPTANLSGTLRSDGGLRIEGHFEGLIEVAGNVVITEGARVAADIAARNVTVGGWVKGNISGTGRLEILSTGQVIGDIVVASVMIDEGGFFQGISRMRGYEHRALSAPQDEDSPSGPVDVYVEEPPEAKVEMMELTARHAASAEDERPAADRGGAAPGAKAPPPTAPEATPAVDPAPTPSPDSQPDAKRAATATSAPPSSTTSSKAPAETKPEAKPPPATKSATPPEPKTTAKAPPAANDEPKPGAQASVGDDEPEIDFDSIEPIIPEIVIEEPPRSPSTSTPTTRGRRRGRTQR